MSTFLNTSRAVEGTPVGFDPVPLINSVATEP